MEEGKKKKEFQTLRDEIEDRLRGEPKILEAGTKDKRRDIPMEDKRKVLNIRVGHVSTNVTEIEVIGSLLENQFSVNGHEYMVASNGKEVILKVKRIVRMKYGSMRRGWDKHDEKES